MTRTVLDLPYLQTETTRHGKVVYYVRRGDGPRCRVSGAYGSIEFLASYDRALRTAPPVEMAGGVYFARLGDRIKIGFSKRPSKRVEGLQTGAPYRISVVHTVPGGRSAEKGLHERFAAQRVWREWFRLEGPVSDFLRGEGVRGLGSPCAR